MGITHEYVIKPQELSVHDYGLNVSWLSAIYAKHDLDLAIF